MYVQNAAKNLMSAVQLRKAYTPVPSGGDCICYVHKEDNSKITFRLQKDGYYHTKLWSGERASVHAVDFYNPAPLTPVAPEDAVTRGGTYTLWNRCTGLQITPMQFR